MGASEVEIRGRLILVIATFVKQANFLFQLPIDRSVKRRDQVMMRFIDRFKSNSELIDASNRIKL